MHPLIIAVKGVFPADQRRSKWRGLVWLQMSDKKMTENRHCGYGNFWEESIIFVQAALRIFLLAY